ncbi:MAG: TAT-variant-translocated molybdopterin oxidoreductase [Candidatus Schekmanbacteria bacterium]|nr:TAT-variant-translocated molybdopterin oxidoreductase [Candidatus Schekmanbacteria bacterium]
MKTGSEMKEGKEYWRSLAHRAATPGLMERMRRELWAPEESPEGGGVDRRKFLGIMGASLALAGVGLTGCVRKPAEQILPYTRRPEDLIPGKPQYYATAAYVGGSVLGLLVESHEGRPTKIEGNPSHPVNAGAASAWAQASILDLYDLDRSASPYKGGTIATWEAFDAEFATPLAALRQAGGRGLAVVFDGRPSPALWGLLQRIVAAYPAIELYAGDAGFLPNTREGLSACGLQSHNVRLDLTKADVILAADCDFLGVEPNAVGSSRQFAGRRRMRSEADGMNRLYCVEPFLSVTGMTADNRLRLQSAKVGAFLSAVAAALFSGGLPLPDGAAEAVGSLDALGAADGNAVNAKWVAAVAADLLRNRGKSLVLVGERQPVWVHALGHLINAALGSSGNTIHYAATGQRPPVGPLGALAARIQAGEISTLMALCSNPVYDAPADLDFAAHLAKVPLSIHLGLHRDETGRAATWHLPACHFLECWGDLEASDGTLSVQQPLIAPLYPAVSDLEFLGRLVATAPVSGYELVKDQWRQRHQALPDFEKQWAKWLHDGVAEAPKGSTEPVAFAWTRAVSAFAAAAAAPVATGTEVAFLLSPAVYDGRFANNGWLQEMPDPTTKLTWDNAALLSPKTAAALGVPESTAAATGRDRAAVLDISLAGRTLRIPAFVVPGTADDTIVIPVGYGRQVGRVASGAGFNANALRTTQTYHFGSGAKVSVTGDPHYELATTQDHGSMEGRPIVRESTLAAYRQTPGFVEKGELLPPERLRALWQPPNPKGGNQWGMAIDLTACTGCGACVMACTSENNVAIVGKQRILNGREMHWLRIDRYFTGALENPEAVVQPVACMQCEMAPCENVCPVAATAHSPEGLNDMAYNRCIGTRYCANNCPYKVRRFNYFNFSRENDEANPMLRMQKNPDVTVRFRGVMEKCTYCVQRIQEVKIADKREGRTTIEDGSIVPACQQTCPTEAIVFGDINDPRSKVSEAKRTNRNYVLLSELADFPRTSYLAKLRNPNPELV